MKRRTAATRDAYGEALVELGERDENVVVLDSDCSASTRTSFFAKRFPGRFFNVGIAEANMIGVAAGLATCGKIPFASSFAEFATARVYEQIRICVCWPNLNVKIVASHAGISVGEDGTSHQITEDIALMRVLPGMKIIVPCDAIETKEAIFTAYETPGPFFIRLARAKFPVIFNETSDFTLGKAKVLREGSDVTIFACGLMLSEALDSAESLSKKGISARVVNMSTIKPIDCDIIIDSAKRTGAIVTCEEHSIIGGLGSAVSDVLVENFPVPMKIVGVKDKFGISGSPEELLKAFEVDKEAIERAVEEVLLRK